MTDIAAIKAALADIPGIDTLTQANVGGRMVFGFGVSPASFTAGIDPSSTDEQIIAALRKVYNARGEAAPAVTPAQIETPMPAPAAAPATPAATKAAPMTPPAPGSFAASLKAMVDEALAGVDRAKVRGHAKVQTAIGKLTDAAAATEHVTDNMAKNIEDQAASVLSELGQISNDLGV